MKLTFVLVVMALALTASGAELCKGVCGEKDAKGADAACYCDDDCTKYKDCCDGYKAECQGEGEGGEDGEGSEMCMALQEVVDGYCAEEPVLLQCVDAEAQAPRDLSSGAQGSRTSKAAVLNEAQADRLLQTNVHFHLGAEHKSDFYNDSTDSEEFDAAQEGDTHQRRLLSEVDTHHRQLLSSEAVRPGFMCPISDLTARQLAPYDWQYCKGEMHVGKSYEVHYVHSTAGHTTLADGLGVAAGGRGLANPMIVVNAQIFQIINEDIPEHMELDLVWLDLVHGWEHTTHTDAVMYAGSTTGTSNTNEVCSPYTVTWHVDVHCHQISAAAFDEMCRVLSEDYGMVDDLHPHGSRILVDEQFVVPADEVYPLA